MDSRKLDIIEIVIGCLFFLTIVSITIVTLCLVHNYHDNLPHHVHFIDTNECFDVKHFSVYKGTALITFNDDSKVECGADNVVCYFNRKCDYCGR